MNNKNDAQAILWICSTGTSLPITLLANDALLSVASPRSPIFTLPVGPVMKMLSHFRSLWMIGGVRVCRKWRPFRIWRLQRWRSFGFISLKRFRYLWSEKKQKFDKKSFNSLKQQNKRQVHYSSLIHSVFFLLNQTHVLRVPEVISSVTSRTHLCPFTVDFQES